MWTIGGQNVEKDIQKARKNGNSRIEIRVRTRVGVPKIAKLVFLKRPSYQYFSVSRKMIVSHWSCFNVEI